jgi:hypothetical protein
METFQTLFEQKYLHLSIDLAAGILVAQWMGFLQLNEVMEGCRVMSHAIRTHGLKLHLSDHTELKSLRPAYRTT